LVVEALVGKVADHKEALVGKGGLKTAGKREALVVKVADRRKVLGAKVGRKAAGRRVAKAARKAVAFRVVLLPLAFQVKASHNPDKDSTWWLIQRGEVSLQLIKSLRVNRLRREGEFQPSSAEAL
jgi:hypothetical protein